MHHRHALRGGTEIWTNAGTAIEPAIERLLRWPRWSTVRHEPAADTLRDLTRRGFGYLVGFIALDKFARCSRQLIDCRQKSASCARESAELRRENAELRQQVSELRCEAGYWKSRHADAVQRNIQLQAELEQAKPSTPSANIYMNCQLAIQNSVPFVGRMTRIHKQLLDRTV